MEHNKDRLTIIRECLLTLDPSILNLKDESHHHAGHPGAKSGGGHYILYIVSPKFQGQSMVQRHRLIYDALGDLMKSEIHALSITAKTPEEESAQ